MTILEHGEQNVMTISINYCTEKVYDLPNENTYSETYSQAQPMWRLKELFKWKL